MGGSSSVNKELMAGVWCLGREKREGELSMLGFWGKGDGGDWGGLLTIYWHRELREDACELCF